MADLPSASSGFRKAVTLIEEASPSPSRQKMFVKASTVPKLPPENLKRQSQITRLACSLFSETADAMRFLNQKNASLGGRPLDLATTSKTGYSAVEHAIRLLTQSHAGDRQ